MLDLIIFPFLLYVFGQTGLSKQCRLQNAASDQGLHYLLLTQQLYTFTGSKIDLLKRSIRKRVPNFPNLSKISPK